METNKQEKIRQAAFKVFSQKGYKETKIIDIASKAGVSPGTIYKYYKGKKAIFQSINQPELETLRPHYQRKQEEILKAALSIFGQKGFTGASMEEIASQCGVSKASLYQYYKSKEDIFCAAVQQDALFCGLDNLSQIGAEEELAQVLKKLACSYLKVMSDPDRINMVRAVISDSARFTQTGELLYNKVLDKFYTKLAHYFDRFKARGELKDVNTKMAARVFIGILMSFVFIDRLINPSEKEFNDSEITEGAVRIFLEGIKKKQVH